MRLAALALFAALGAGGAHAAPAPPTDAAAIRAVMEDSFKAWSAGDLAGFMTSYEEGPDTVFVTPKGPLKGYDAIAAMYREHFGDTKEALGVVSLSDLDVQALSPGYAVVYGRFHLVHPGKPGEDTGVFDLIFHKGAKGWRIVSDHTS